MHSPKQPTQLNIYIKLIKKKKLTAQTLNIPPFLGAGNLKHQTESIYKNIFNSSPNPSITRIKTCLVVFQLVRMT